MPSFAYTNSTNFRPFSYEELLAPLLMATQAHQEVEEAYGALGTDAGAVGSLIDQQNDPDAYALYKAFSDRLSSESDTLSKRGLTPASRQNLINMRRRYANDITKIQNAITRRREMADEQRKGVLENPTLMYQRNFNISSWDTSLDRFLENPEYNYGDVYSGALITKQVSEMASHLATELRGVKSGRLDAYTKTFLKNYGLTSDEVLLAINNPNDPRASKALAAIYDSALSAVPQSIRTQYADQVRAYAQQGFWSAIGKSEVSPYEDFGARLAAEEASKKRLIDYQNQQKQLNGLSLNPRSVYSQRQRSDAEKNFQDNMKKYSKYFYKGKDGKTHLTYAGLQEYRRNAAPRVTSAGSGSGTARLMNVETQYQNAERGFTPTDFKKFIDSIGGSMRMEEGAGWNSARIGSLWDKYMENPVAATAGYDANKYTEYYYNIDPSERDVWKGNILRTAVNGEFEEVDFDSKSGQYKPTGKTISVEELNSEDYEVLGTSLSNLGANGRGNTATIKDDKGNIRTIKLNPGINERGEDATMQYINYASMLEQIPDEGGFIVGPDGRQRYVTREQADDEYYRALDTAHSYWSQLGVTNKTKPQEFSAYSW